MTSRGRTIVALIRSPRRRQGTTVRLPLGAKITSELYDRVAYRVLVEALRRYRSLPVERRSGRVLVRRVFVSPCPRSIRS